MITAKFGGTAVTPRNLSKLKSLLTDNHNCIVVSAIGKENATDAKVTDLLKELYFSLPDEKIFTRIEKKYRKIVSDNSISIDVDRLLFDALSEIRACRDLKYVMSKGEELSAKIVSAYLKCDYVEAEDTVRFSKDKLLYKQTLHNLKSAFKGVKRAVLAGFYGGNKESRQTFSRGGSDITAALAANATDSTLYENWTDVNGLCVADPHKIPNVATVRCLSYSDMRLLARAGASVLHPDAVRPAEEKAIPISIRNFFNFSESGTLVCNSGRSGGILGLTEKKNGGVYVTTVVFSLPKHQLLSSLSSFLASQTVDSQNLNRVGLSRLNFAGSGQNQIFSCSINDNFLEISSADSIVRKLYDFLPVD